MRAFSYRKNPVEAPILLADVAAVAAPRLPACLACSPRACSRRCKANGSCGGRHADGVRTMARWPLGRMSGDKCWPFRPAPDLHERCQRCSRTTKTPGLPRCPRDPHLAPQPTTSLGTSPLALPCPTSRRLQWAVVRDAYIQCCWRTGARRLITAHQQEASAVRLFVRRCSDAGGPGPGILQIPHPLHPASRLHTAPSFASGPPPASHSQAVIDFLRCPGWICWFSRPDEREDKMRSFCSMGGKREV